MNSCVSVVSPLYRTRTIKRDRRTKGRVDQLDDQILAVLVEDHPQSVRHVFYRMTDPRLEEPVEKSDRGYRHVQDRLKKLRRAGQVPYAWISDATRRGYHINTFNSAADFLRRMNGLYRADLWRNADHYCEVWTESRSLAGVIEDDVEELAVSLYPAGGFSIHHARIRGGRFHQPKPRRPRRGDLLHRRLRPCRRAHRRCAGKRTPHPSFRDITLHFERIGITEEQIAALRLADEAAKGGRPPFRPGPLDGRGGGHAGRHHAATCSETEIEAPVPSGRACCRAGRGAIGQGLLRQPCQIRARCSNERSRHIAIALGGDVVGAVRIARARARP